MPEILYLVIGALVGGMMILLLPYRSVRRAYIKVYEELVDVQTKHNDLQSSLIEQQTTTYQSRQAMLAQQKKIENDLTQAHMQYSELERQRDGLNDQIDQQQQALARETAQLRGVISRLEQEQIALQDRFAQESVQWDRERQSLLLHNGQLEEQLRALRQDKAAQESRQEHLQETWERERLALQIQVNTLEDNLALQKARSGHPSLPPDSVLLMEQVKQEASTEFNRQRAAWEEERRSLKEQMERLQTERASSPRSSGSANDQETQNLRQLLDQERQERHAMEAKLEARHRQSERERAALESEIEQLMERLLRMQR